jgi:hypothetical protein
MDLARRIKGARITQDEGNEEQKEDILTDIFDKYLRV